MAQQGLVVDISTSISTHLTHYCNN